MKRVPRHSFLHKKIGGSNTYSGNKQGHRKKLVTTASRSESVYKRTGEPSVTFFDKGGTVKHMTDFLHKKIGTSDTCSDVVPKAGVEPAREISPTGF